MDNWQNNIRKRYKRYIRKYIKLFNISIIDSKNINNLEEIAKEYMELHIMDAGKKTRNLESYIKQVEFIKEDEAFFVKAESSITGITEGMLLVTLIKTILSFLSEIFKLSPKEIPVLRYELFKEKELAEDRLPE